MGTRGSTSFPELKLWHYDSPTGSWTDELTVDGPEPVDPTPPLTVQLRHFAQVCEGRVEPNCSGLEALKTIITLEAIKESMETGLPVEVSQG
jgi:predicted dehydrogenase